MAPTGSFSWPLTLGDLWIRADVKFQAEHVATQRLHNGGYNCVGTQLVIVPANWKRQDLFLTALRHAVENAPVRSACYPGSDERVAASSDDYPQAAHLGKDHNRLLATGLDVDTTNALITTEYFSPVLGVVEIPAEGTEFLDRAADFVNQRVNGTLGIDVLAHPRVLRRLGGRFEKFLASLHYGTIAVNAWTGFDFLTATASWGAFPGHTIDNVQSGIGVVHNALLVNRPERTVVRGPFRPIQRSLLTSQLSISPKPPWFVSNRTGAKTSRLLVDFVGRPSLTKIPAIFASALRG